MNLKVLVAGLIAAGLVTGCSKCNQNSADEVPPAQETTAVETTTTTASDAATTAPAPAPAPADASGAPMDEHATAPTDATGTTGTTATTSTETTTGH